ncbi:MAG TPA: hypothetical protein DCS76_02900 [Gemmatimonadetes bacterium]|nr:hypothetical protein [Gemmatimonadota bacterium]HAT16714.1 hypothetical protein [Gemmatimonadota bacterium]
MPFGRHNHIVFDPDADAHVVVRASGTLDRALEIQARLHGQNHASLQHPRRTGVGVVTDVVHVESEPM